MRHPILLLAATLVAWMPLPAGAVTPGFRVWLDEFPLAGGPPVFIAARAPTGALSTLTREGHATGPALEAAESWDFSVVAPPADLGTYSQVVVPSNAWSCYLPDTSGCGFGAAGVDRLLVQENAEDAQRNVLAFDVDAQGRVLTRASSINEGDAGEIRLCLPPGLTPDVVTYAFPRTDGNRRYVQVGDSFQSDVFNCVHAGAVGAQCSAGGGIAAALDDSSGTLGRFTGRAVRAGTLTLPSGHVVDAMLTETLLSTELRVLGCIAPVKIIRQYTLAWLVPHLGPVVSVLSPEDTPDFASWTTAATTFIGYGPLPPLSLTLLASTPDSLSVSWDAGPGIAATTGWIVQWGTTDGRVAGLPFESALLPAAQASYTLGGLQPGTTYWVSVIAARQHLDPNTGTVLPYRSLQLPKTIGADIDGDGTQDTSYPPQLAASTAVADACLAGDIIPDGIGNGSVTLADYVGGRRKLLGTMPVNARDRSCGDVAPGAYACEPPGQAGRWCIAGNQQFQTADVLTIRRRVTGALTFSCTGCPQVARRPGESRSPGDLVPRGATDGVLDIADIVFALRASVGSEALSAEELRRGDVAPSGRAGEVTEALGDGRIDVADVVLLLRAAVGLEDLHWPLRGMTVRLRDPGAFIGYSVRVTGWPPWAAPEESFEPLTDGCDDTAQAATDGTWTATCLTDPLAHEGPLDLLRFRYRAIEPVPASSLAPVAGWPLTYLTAPDLGEVAANIELRMP